MHTKEPWIVTGSDRIKYIEARTVNGMLQEIASCLTVSEENGNHEENARRIVACVNACAGITTEALECSPSTLSIIHVSEIEHMRNLQQHRDELLAALKEISEIENEMYGADWDEIEKARSIAKAAIEKADLTQ